jgi:phosphoribosyl-ATP pyrophosphohydrolase/phosphoribosyl-AMP cyclohydrolase
MLTSSIDKLDWLKAGGLIPAVVQHAESGVVLMVGYMNREALTRTIESRHVTFYSRTRGKLWTKGETSDHWLDLVDVFADCDNDTLLVLARPNGPTCHTGSFTCFPDATAPRVSFLAALDAVVAERERDRPIGSYAANLFDSGIKRIAQKVGEEGVETALAAVAEDDKALLDESADLLFHLIVLLRAKGMGIAELVTRLAERHK